MVDNTKNCVKIVYERKPCRKCGGQVMTIFVMREMIYRRCIKCDGKGIRGKGIRKPRPDCIEERIGKLMCIYYTNKDI